MFLTCSPKVVFQVYEWIHFFHLPSPDINFLSVGQPDTYSISHFYLLCISAISRKRLNIYGNWHSMFLPPRIVCLFIFTFLWVVCLINLFKKFICIFCIETLMCWNMLFHLKYSVFWPTKFYFDVLSFINFIH